MGIEKRFNSICGRLRRRLGIKNSEEEDMKRGSSTFVSVPDLRKSWRKFRKNSSKRKPKEEKELGVSLARFDEDLVSWLK